MPRNDLTIQDKIAILDKIKTLPPRTTQRQISVQLGVPKSTSSATKITRRMYKKQTVNLDVVEKALLRQIKPRDEEELLENRMSEEENSNCESPTCTNTNDTDQDLKKLLNIPPIEVAHRNYVGKHKSGNMEREESAVKVKASITEGQMKTTTINPDIKRIEFMEIAKTVTDLDEGLLSGVEEVWSALGPLVIESDDEEKRTLLREMFNDLQKRTEIQKMVFRKLIVEHERNVCDFERGLSAELDKKYNAVLEEMKAKMGKDSSYAIDCLLKEFEDQNRFEIEWFRNEGVEKYQERVRLFTQFCNLWMKIMEAAEKRSSLNENQMAVKDRRLIADVQNMEESLILKSVAHLNIDHELIQTTLADFLYKRDQEIIRRKENVEELQKKVDIWKNLVNDLLTQFQKFVTFALNEQPVQTQYLLSLNEMYNQFLEDYLQAEHKTAAAASQNMAVDRIKALYPTCGPPDRLSQGSSVTPDTTLSVDTDTEKPKCLVPDYIMTAIAKGEFPQKPPSYDELVYRKEQEIEDVVQTFGYEPSDNVTWDTQSTENFKEALAYATPRPETSSAIQEDCAYMDESTKSKIDEVLNLMHTKPEIMKGFITL